MEKLTRAALLLLALNVIVLVVLYLLPMPDEGEIPGRDARTIVGTP
ncbi:MAG TPA: hypothetical protein QGF58_13105 [Myxococcota bacterium]|nr:hypothetical protein [Myxococcota bacterium]